MATQYTTILKLALPTQGELDGSWGTTVNNNITSMVEEAVAGRSVINTWSSNSHTLTTANGTTAEARAAMLSLTDTGDQLGSNAATVICPAASKIYIVTNAVGQAATLKTASGTGIAIPNGATMLLFCDGTNVVEGINNITGTLTTAAITASGAVTTAALTASGILKTDNTTEATSTTDGSLQTDGGLSIVKDAVFGDDVKLLSDAAVLSFGANSEVTLTHVHDDGLLLNTDMQLQFRDSAINIRSDADGDLDINADDEVEINSTLIDINGNLDVSGTGVIAGAITGAAITASGILKTDDTTEATSTTDGSLQTDGGLSVAKDAVFGDDVKLLSDSAVLNFGADSDTTLTHTDGSGLTLNSTNKIMFNDASQFIQGSSGTVLSLGATDEIDLTATTIDINGAVALNGAITGATDITLSGELDAATLDISGNADIDGTTNLDAVDIDGAVQIDSTVTVGVDDTGYDVKFFGATASRYMLWDESADTLLLPDNVKASFGTGSDLQIYHDGSDSYIADGGTGDLKIGGATNVKIQNPNGSEVMGNFAQDGAVTLYHNNVVKFATSANGASITGTLLATTASSTINGSNQLDYSTNQNFVITLNGNLTLANPADTEQVGQAGVMVFIQDGTGSRTLSLGSQYKTAGDAGITLSTAANAVDIVPYFVSAADTILVGAVQLALSGA
tara:strand:+ start:1945 stop:3984 length:2040 start_codon:yes stop_codon:yes gene_type:complete